MRIGRACVATASVVGAASGILALDMGLRQAFGLFLEPVTGSIAIGAGAFGLAVALQNVLWGLLAPVAGAVADRHGSFPVVVYGGGLYTVGLFLSGIASSAAGFVAAAGLIIGLGMSACCFPLIMAVVSRRVPPETRSVALGTTMAGAGFGQFAVPIGVQQLLSEFEIVGAFMAAAAVMAIVVPLGIVLCRNDEPDRRLSDNAISIRSALAAAARDRSYRFLTAGFFVCGFHVAIVATHLPAYLLNHGLTGFVGASALAIIGLFNMVGAFVFGALGSRYSKVRLLVIIYVARAIAFLGVLAMPITPVTALFFAASIGFIWNATVPLTSAVTGDLFGPRYLATLFGIVTASHQLGAGLGAWLGGWIFDVTGEYGWAWLLSAMLAVGSALLHTPIRDHTPTAARPHDW